MRAGLFVAIVANSPINSSVVRSPVQPGAEPKKARSRSSSRGLVDRLTRTYSDSPIKTRFARIHPATSTTPSLRASASCTALHSEYLNRSERVHETRNHVR